MKVVMDIFRKRPDQTEGYRQTFELDAVPGQVVLDMFYKIQEEMDPTFAFRYSCRGAICGSCAVRINDKAALACKTQVIPLAEEGVIKIDPLTNMGTIRDLVSDMEPFWEAYNAVRPFLERKAEQHDERFIWADKLDARYIDQLNRAIDCIKCAACFSDCPKRTLEARFIGPQACLQLYKFYFDPRDGLHEWRTQFGVAPGGPFDCDNYGNCVRVCPKNCIPLRAINFLRQDLRASKEG